MANCTDQGNNALNLQGRPPPFAKDTGVGPCLLLLHAFPLDHRLWAHQITSFRNSHRVIAHDVRGFGRSPLSQGPWSFSDIADDILCGLDTLNIPSLTVIGLSMGGYLAFELVRKRPSLIQRLVLADTRPDADNQEERSARTQLAESVSQIGTDSLVKIMAPKLLRKRPDPSVTKVIQRWIAEASPQAVIHALIAMRERPDSTPLLANIACPTLVLSGSEDLVTSVQDCRKLAEAISDSRYKEIPDSGHISNLENPTAFNRALDDFLSL